MKQVVYTLIIMSLILSCNSIKENPVIKSEATQIITSVINLEKLQQYYHYESIADRTPLIISKHDRLTSDDLNGIEKFGEPILLLSKEDIEAKKIEAYLEIIEWTKKEAEIRLKMKYAIEGVIIDCTFKKEDLNWKIIQSSITES